MTLSGRIEDHSFAEILRNLTRSRETAVVTLTSDGATKSVHVQAGRVIFAQSSDADDRLGECLLREGMISVEQYEASVRLIGPGKKQGTILVELGYITPAELVKGVKLQVEHVVGGLLSWRHGAYSIDMREIDTRDIIALNISTENLLFQGIKRGAGWSQIVRGLGGTLDSVLVRAPEFDTKMYKLDLTDDESHVVSLVNGRLSAAQICSMSYLSNHDTCLTLHALCCCGVIEPGKPRDPETLFREQVAETEVHDVRALVAAFNDGLAASAPALIDAHSDGVANALQAACDAVFDEHWDALREARLGNGQLDPDLVVDNLADVEPGLRRDLLERALQALAEAIAAQAGLAAGPVAAGQIRAAFAAAGSGRRR